MYDNGLRIDGVAVSGRLAPLSALVARGRLVHIIGPNGAGKSTLLLRLAGLLSGEGEVWLAGRPLLCQTPAQQARWRACLLQQQLPTGLMPVFAYLGLHAPRTAPISGVDTVLAMLSERLGLSDKLSRPMSHLSGGEWQRVRLAAVLLQIWPTLNPQGYLLLLDEPMSSLDIRQQAALDGLLSELCAAGVTVIASAHDLNHTLFHADDVWMLSQGQVMAQGTAQAVMQVAALSTLFGVPFRRIRGGDRDWLYYHNDEQPESASGK
ncbi:vitamin B12 ABC transporter ATP-binding protein BtuD [Edwardsiella ictaluri]|uniref:Vitamin B12 import ATP-binding protein BtuD n=1 Tax=Edwardsiella ictaluri TaxID=67780 RepID=A0ABY8GFX1_EDWIC|nr:vitamin B12 ABC transporter ATP-binding protein BtuD [Edwardsiella ictaluri]ARD38426.1 vitamin B12 ABC transporter ATP-binding protein BtuD [Edwardsiella ictaluri]ELV7529140.1 vitamin B12 ABC transporter ATP-binding protein BtuD [Edwardsiella ictaluri]KMQ77815.1 vitamin B12 ABC transporter ATPase [Edwardsiella ictaluri]KOO54636.1 vitamin B12 ABC transporter ATPase [Edwardsiella ictaluri]QPW26844.1 vitamin B12 ABC transporter ATP-binding protein BtuD [Edwardsiella ictaluri]